MLLLISTRQQVWSHQCPSLLFPSFPLSLLDQFLSSFLVSTDTPVVVKMGNASRSCSYVGCTTADLFHLNCRLSGWWRLQSSTLLSMLNIYCSDKTLTEFNTYWVITQTCFNEVSKFGNVSFLLRLSRHYVTERKTAIQSTWRHKRTRGSFCSVQTNNHADLPSSLCKWLWAAVGGLICH